MFEPELHHLVAVDRVRVGVGHVVLGLVRGQEVLTARVRLQVLGRDRALGQRVERGRDPTLGRVGVRVRAYPVAAEHLGGGEGRVDVLGDLDGAVGDDAGEVEAVGSLALDRRGVGAEVGRGRVDPGVAHDIDTVIGLLQPEQGGQPLSVRLLVVGDGDLGAARLLHRHQAGGGLDRVDRHDPQVGTGPGWVVLLRLAGGAARQVRRQADVRVRRAHLRDSRLVEDRDRHLAGAGVELAHVVDGLRIRGDLARVGRRLARVPLPGRGGRVVEHLVVHRPLAGLVVGLRERELDPVDQRNGLRARGSLHREARVEVDRAATGRAAAAGGRAAAAAATGGRQGDYSKGCDRRGTSHYLHLPLVDRGHPATVKRAG